jgi:hypothetical protein
LPVTAVEAHCKLRSTRVGATPAAALLFGDSIFALDAIPALHHAETLKPFANTSSPSVITIDDRWSRVLAN